MRILLGGAAAVVLGLACAGCGKGAVSSAKASDTVGPRADSVTAVGCAKAPKAECVAITADGKTWDVTGAGVDLNRGVAVSVTGTPGPAGACGPTLTGATVEYTGLQCAKPAS